MVEDVEEVATQLQLSALADSPQLRYRQIDIIGVRSAKAVVAADAELAGSRIHETVGVEIMVDRLVPDSGVGIADPGGKERADEARIRVIDRSYADWGGAGDGPDAGHS